MTMMTTLRRVTAANLRCVMWRVCFYTHRHIRGGVRNEQYFQNPLFQYISPFVLPLNYVLIFIYFLLLIKSLVNVD